MNMAPLCGIIPEYVLQTIVENRVAPQHVINRCQSTIEKIRHLHDVRIRHGLSLTGTQRQQTSQGIIPPYILELIARNAATEQQREAARHTLAHRAKNIEQ
jgi:hypothetical protein